MDKIKEYAVNNRIENYINSLTKIINKQKCSLNVDNIINEFVKNLNRFEKPVYKKFKEENLNFHKYIIDIILKLFTSKNVILELCNSDDSKKFVIYMIEYVLTSISPADRITYADMNDFNTTWTKYKDSKKIGNNDMYKPIIIHNTQGMTQKTRKILGLPKLITPKLITPNSSEGNPNEGNSNQGNSSQGNSSQGNPSQGNSSQGNSNEGTQTQGGRRKLTRHKHKTRKTRKNRKTRRRK